MSHFVSPSDVTVGNMLNFNRRLVELNVQETQLGNTGVTMVAQALHINTVHAYPVNTITAYLLVYS